MAVSVRVAMAVGPSGNWLLLLMHVMQRGRAGVGGSGAARTLETAVRDVSVTALTQGRTAGMGTTKALLSSLCNM